MSSIEIVLVALVVFHQIMFWLLYDLYLKQKKISSNWCKLYEESDDDLRQALADLREVINTKPQEPNPDNVINIFRGSDRYN